MTEPSKSTIKYWKQCYQTPPEFLYWLEAKWLPRYGHSRFTLDACAEPWNAKCEEFIAPPGTLECPGMIGINGLTTDWVTQGAVWCNPGFSGIWPWARQARKQADAGRLTFMIAHATHAAQWAQWTIKHASACLLINPRINFDEDPRLISHLAQEGKKPSGNNRDSMVWVFAPNHEGPCEFINPEPWMQKGRRKKAA